MKIRKMLHALGVVAILTAVGPVGCGGGGDGGESVSGTWSIKWTQYDCYSQWEFGANNEVTYSDMCNLKSGGAGVYVRQGAYSVSGNNLMVASTKSSCPGEARRTASLSVSRGQQNGVDSLTLTSSQATTVLLRGQVTLTGTATYGCFDAQQRFTGSPIADLR